MVIRDGSISVSKASNDVEALIALRDRLAAEIDATDSPQIVAILTRQFLAVIADLADLKPAASTKVDEIAEKYSRKLRAIRDPNPPNKASTKRKAQPG